MEIPRRMNNDKQFSKFILDQKSFRRCSTDEKIDGIVELFDNNDEGVLRKREIRQILICLFLTENMMEEEEAIEVRLRKIMKTTAGRNDCECITKDEFVENIQKDPILNKMLK